MTEQPSPLTHAKLGTSLMLLDDDLYTQAILNRFMAAMRELKLGDSAPEENCKILYAGLKSGVVREARVSNRADPLGPQDAMTLKPVIVKWFARHIDAQYARLTKIPPE